MPHIKRNLLFAEEKPWEPRFDNFYANVLYDEDEDLYKCWYSPFIIDQSTTNTPKKGRVNGGKENNIVRRGPQAKGCYAVGQPGALVQYDSAGLRMGVERRDRSS